ncbi:MAG TPA: helix-turn-helix domain-containing protein [Aggregatilineaceae bacterium]|nr:helix-turn-helix domain-containing protein [Aggregatilineaceae bacterium]
MDNRAVILARALDLFAARGYDAVGVQEIVEAAGVTKPTLYHYFGSKRGLLDVLLQAHFERLIEQVEKAAIYQGDLTLTLEKVMKAYSAFAKTDGDFYRMQLGMYFAPPESESFKAVYHYHEQQYAIMERVFVQAVVNHGNMRGRQQRYAISFLGMINNYLSLWLNGYLEMSDKLIYDALHQFMHGIFS